MYYKEISSYPVGYEKIIDLYPLDFEEFLWSLGINESTITIVRNSFNNKAPLDEYILKQFEEKFKMYIIVGGMPAVVNDFIETNSLSKVLESQRALIDNYKFDVLKYASSTNKQKILNTFQSIPIQLSQINKKFSYTAILNEEENNGGERKYASSIDWLRDAGIINCCYNLTEPASQLTSNLRLNCFKIYMQDTGLLISMFESGVQKDLLNDNLYINEGAILENICAGELKTRYEKVMYFEKKSKLEIDFILNIDGKVTAVEVKSGNNKQAKSLKSIIENYKTVSRYIKLEKDTNIYVDDNNIEHYPLFMIMFL